ncbi:Coiled-coil and C2 domain-containing protein 1B [Mortierella polycephala]|uniref:Coiled-coil and C2 domain-containing protein 1B n=1 Tax=Mortierella polycephala TaxID=41804 RepID=A0A9P6TZX9_9FUNG|nr:Coiled-coil and C2 domain-containing protein 1B [Mortierella polycephala]
MFSWKKQNPPSKQRQQQQQGVGVAGDYNDLIAHGMRLANEDIDDSGNGDEYMGEDGDEDLGDIDLDDPELLAELHGLTGETPAPAPKHKPTARLSQPPPSSAPAPVHSSSQPALITKPAAAAAQPRTHPASKLSNSTAPAVAPSLPGHEVDIDGIMEEDDDEEVELTEDDWKDPHFLAQLQSLGGHAEHQDQEPHTKTDASGKSPTKSKSVSESITITESKPIPAPLEPLSTDGTHTTGYRRPISASSSMIAIPPQDKAYNDEDMDGDSIMAEQVEESRAEPAPDTTPSTTTAKPPKRLEEVPKKNDKDLLQLLRLRDVQYKRAALDAKRAGDMALAAQRVKIFKSLQSWIGLVEAGGFLDLELYPIPDEPAAKPSNTKPDTNLVGQPVVSASPAPAGPSSSAAPGSTPSDTYIPPIKSSGQEATTHVSSSIAEASANDLRSGASGRGKFGGGIEFRQLAADDDFKIVSNSEGDTYDMLESQLESQIKMCTTACAYYYKSGDTKTAMEFRKLNKIFQADLVSLQSYRSHGKKAPAFHFQDVRFELEIGFHQEIGLNELSLSVVRAWDLTHKDVRDSDIESYVAWDLGWPTENMPGAGSGKGTTSTVKRTPKPDFNFSKTLRIERTRGFQWFVERKKATFEVWHYRGLLWKDYLLGRAQVPLQNLSNHSEIHEVVPLMDPTGRRKTNGKIEVKIRLQRPLLKPEIVIKEEKWLVIDEFNSGGLGFPSPVTAKPSPQPTGAPVSARSGTPAVKARKATPSTAPGNRASPAQASRPKAAPPPTVAPVASKEQAKSTTPSTGQPAALAARANNPSPVPSKPPAAAVTKRSSAAPAGELEESESDKALNELNSVDLLVSNMVLENEIQATQKMIHDAKAVGNNEVAEEYQDRQAQLEIKMKLLVLQVQTGQLTMEAYCERVKDRIGKDKRLAIELKKLGMVSEAKRALMRSKVMENEMKEVEEAMAAQGDEDDDEE